MPISTSSVAAAALWGPFIVAVLVAAAAALKTRDDLGKRMGLPAWDFTQSWASNISVVGGLVSLSTVTGLLGSYSPKFLPMSAYTALDFAFPLLAVLAPLVYNFSRTVQVKSNGAGDTTILSEGIVAMFIVASGFTIWACL